MHEVESYVMQTIIMDGQSILADSVFCVITNERLKVHAVISYSDYKFIVQIFTYYFIQ